MAIVGGTTLEIAESGLLCGRFDSTGIDGLIYVMGGWNLTNRVDRFNPRTQQWLPHDLSYNLPFANNCMAAAVSGWGRIYVVGGEGGLDAVIFNPIRNCLPIGVVGDISCDGVVDALDIEPFIQILFGG